MKYASPEINALGDTAEAIQAIGKTTTGLLETFNPQDPRPFQPAYDLDE